MANKLPWFTHDHNAHQDVWIRHLVRKQGHVAGWLWWVILELLHQHGVGDTLKIDITDMARAGLTSNSVVIRVLTEMATEFQTRTKLSFTLDGTELRLEIKKFRERQANLKIKTISRPLQDHSKTTIEREREGEREKENRLVPSAPQNRVVSNHKKPTKELTPQQNVIRYFKEAKGVDANDKEWDKRFWNGRLGKDANAILKAFGGDVKRAGEYILVKGEEWAHLPDWGLNGVAAAAGRDPRINGGIENEREHSEMVPASLGGSGRNRGTASSREIAFDALKSIKSMGIYAPETTDMEADGFGGGYNPENDAGKLLAEGDGRGDESE